MKHPADLMLSEAVDGLRASPDATARALGYALHRRHGDDASRLADLVVGAVQEAQRAPAMPVVDAEYIEPPEPAPEMPALGIKWLVIGAIGFALAGLLGTVAIPAPPPFEPGPGFDICTTEGC